MTLGGFVPTPRVDIGTRTNVSGIPVDADGKISKLTEDQARLAAGLTPGADYVDSETLDQAIGDTKNELTEAMQSALDAWLPGLPRTMPDEPNVAWIDGDIVKVSAAWVMTGGVWDDSGSWMDSQIWSDN